MSRNQFTHLHPDTLFASEAAGSRITCIVAHMDDEALMCGGLLCLLAGYGARITAIVVCDPKFTNRPSKPDYDADEEERRITRRRVAWQRSCAYIRAVPVELGLWNLSEADTIPESCVDSVREVIRQHVADPGLLISHGIAGEYGHAMHKVVHAAVAREAKEPWLGFAGVDGAIKIPIGADYKRTMLRFYYDGTTQTPTWNPFRHPEYAPWCRDIESFDWYQPC